MHTFHPLYLSRQGTIHANEQRSFLRCTDKIALQECPPVIFFTLQDFQSGLDNHISLRGINRRGIKLTFHDCLNTKPRGSKTICSHKQAIVSGIKCICNFSCHISHIVTVCHNGVNIGI